MSCITFPSCPSPSSPPYDGVDGLHPPGEIEGAGVPHQPSALNSDEEEEEGEVEVAEKDADWELVELAEKDADVVANRRLSTNMWDL
jgi:hypothetical protein